MDLYVILGLGRSATLGEIKRAYKRLARKHHPDINPGDRTSAAHFRQIAEAYETLSNPDRRKRYDSTGESTVRDDSLTRSATIRWASASRGSTSR
jgi:curved DNA-binding protein CbpA